MTVYRHRVRVRYAETDAMGVAHHSAYLLWLEEARIAALAAVGLPYAEVERSGVFMPVVSVHVDYRRPLRFDDEVDLLTTVTLPGPSRVVFTTRLERGETHIADGVVTVAAVASTGRPRRLPDRLIELVTKVGLRPQPR